jgi:hypothetical protein
MLFVVFFSIINFTCDSPNEKIFEKYKFKIKFNKSTFLQGFPFDKLIDKDTIDVISEIINLQNYNYNKYSLLLDDKTLVDLSIFRFDGNKIYKTFYSNNDFALMIDDRNLSHSAKIVKLDYVLFYDKNLQNAEMKNFWYSIDDYNQFYIGKEKQWLIKYFNGYTPLFTSINEIDTLIFDSVLGDSVTTITIDSRVKIGSHIPSEGIIRKESYSKKYGLVNYSIYYYFAEKDSLDRVFNLERVKK